MVFFMVFIACSKAENIDTMRGKLMLAWYQRTLTARALEQSGDLLHQYSFKLLCLIQAG